MKRGLSFTFFIGLLIGALVALLFWYWQKSTSAEDGALALLDRLAEADRRLRRLMTPHAGEAQTPSNIGRVQTAVTDEMPSFLTRPSPAGEAEDLTQVKGIGPVFARRLQEAGIETITALTAVAAADLAAILQIPESRAETILAAASNLA